MSWEEVLKERKKRGGQSEDPDSPVAIQREKTYQEKFERDFNTRNKKRYEEFLSKDNPQDDSLTLSIAMRYAEERLEQVSDDDKYDEAQEALELVKEVQKAIDTLEDVGLQLQEILPPLLENVQLYRD